MATSVSECLRSRILKSLPKMSKNSCCDEPLQEYICDEVFFTETSYLKNLPINNQNLVFVREFIFL